MRYNMRWDLICKELRDCSWLWWLERVARGTVNKRQCNQYEWTGTHYEGPEIISDKIYDETYHEFRYHKIQDITWREI